jgi:hypothetical protein
MADKQTYHERCLKCKWLAPDLTPPCGRLFSAQIAVAPLGGTVNIDFTPGMIPVEFEDKMRHMLGRIFEQVEITMQAWPGWDELGELMRSNPEKELCPGRDSSENPYLKLVKM